MSGTIDLSDLPLFLAVARHGSFVEASRELKTPPNTTSRAVARLEDALGVRLFHRTSRRVSLTHEGAHLLGRAGGRASELQSVLDDMTAQNQRPVGRVRLSAPVMTGAGRIARSLVTFAAKHPHISLDLQLTNSLVDLVEGGIDVAFRAGPIANESLVAKKLWEVPFEVAASSDFVRRHLRGRRSLTAERLAALPAITTTGDVWRFAAPDGATHDIRLSERLRVNDPRVAIDAAASGLGVVRAPSDAVKHAGLVALSCTAGRLESRSMFAVFPSRRLLQKRVRLVIDWIADDAG